MKTKTKQKGCIALIVCILVLSFQTQAQYVVDNAILHIEKSQDKFAVTNKTSCSITAQLTGVGEIVLQPGLTLLAADTHGFIDLTLEAGPCVSEKQRYVLCLYALPISLSSFSAQRVDDGVKVSWTTATESNNKEFILLVSHDAKSWREVGTVASKSQNGFSSSELRYDLLLSHKQLSGVISLALLPFLCLGVTRFRKKIRWFQVGTCLLFIVLLVSACRKPTVSLSPKNQEIYILLQQLDRDGGESLSPIIHLKGLGKKRVVEFPLLFYGFLW